MALSLAAIKFRNRVIYDNYVLQKNGDFLERHNYDHCFTAVF
jgi:hypothetical protein